MKGKINSTFRTDLLAETSPQRPDGVAIRDGGESLDFPILQGTDRRMVVVHVERDGRDEVRTGLTPSKNSRQMIFLAQRDAGQTHRRMLGQNLANFPEKCILGAPADHGGTRPVHCFEQGNHPRGRLPLNILHAGLPNQAKTGWRILADQREKLPVGNSLLRETGLCMGNQSRAFRMVQIKRKRQEFGPQGSQIRGIGLCSCPDQ